MHARSESPSVQRASVSGRVETAQLPHAQSPPPGPPSAQPIENNGLYGHVFRDSEDQCLFVRPLGAGASCRTQLVYSNTAGEVRLRKALCCPDSAAAETLEECARDVRTAQLLHDAANSAARHELRVPRVVSITTSSAGSPVSYWEVCNGGTLYDFAIRALQAGHVFPQGLALHMLLQCLETLDFMYTALEQPIYHRDLHEGNQMLHWAPGNTIPDVYLIDFGRAIHAQPEDGEIVANEGGGALPEWDVLFVLDTIEDYLAPLVLSPEQRQQLRAAGECDASYLSGRCLLARCLRSHYGTSCNPGCIHPLRHAYQMLVDLQDEFTRRKLAAETDGAPPSSPSSPSCGRIAPTPPSLRDVIAFLRSAVDVHLGSANLQEDDEHRPFYEKVLRPARDRALQVSRGQPKLCRTVAGLGECLEQAGVEAPWDVVEVESNGSKFRAKW